MYASVFAFQRYTRTCIILSFSRPRQYDGKMLSGLISGTIRPTNAIITLSNHVISHPPWHVICPCGDNSRWYYSSISLSHSPLVTLLLKPSYRIWTCLIRRFLFLLWLSGICYYFVFILLDLDVNLPNPMTLIELIRKIPADLYIEKNTQIAYPGDVSACVQIIVHSFDYNYDVFLAIFCTYLDQIPKNIQKICKNIMKNRVVFPINTIFAMFSLRFSR